ncbi:MAG: glycosyltransferase [Anaerolineae bacterium]|nr:glycosyltransferase [Anaerolineae bacterium]MDW8068537.1 glycosyltransferase [Anaerolineae bacterium]
MLFLELRPLLHILVGLYLLIILWLAAYGLHSWVLLVLYWRHRKHARDTTAMQLPSPRADLPVVTVQLPLYNERYVVRRLIDTVASLDYPRDRLEIQVLDDSTDETTAIARARAAFWQARGVDIQVLHRSERTGFKAGALAWGLQQARGELIAIFDADFCPHPDFLLRVVPHFLADPRLGMVQTRWAHLNDEHSLVTQAQAIALDGHFVVEQTARSQTGLLMHFNGSGGVWRRVCIEASGGWQSETVCEDLDLSYRAQLAGWRCRFLPDVDCPAELPPQVLAFKRQQARWAKGSVQCLRKLARPLLRSPHVGPWQKLLGLLHLSGYLVYPLLVLMLLLTPITFLVPSPLGNISRLLGPLCLGPMLVYGTGQWALYRDWKRRLRAFPVLMLIGTGVAWGNTLALLEGLIRWGGEFVRTPKFRLDGRRGNWQRSGYRLREDRAVGGEIALALYALGMVAWAWSAGRVDLLPFLLLYSAAFGVVAGISLYEMGQKVPRPVRRPGRMTRKLRPDWGSKSG